MAGRFDLMNMDHRRERLRCLKELELKETATDEDIKKAYRLAAMKYHPDKNTSEDATSKFQQISAAYRYLTEGHVFFQKMRDEENSAEVSILRYLFPWLFNMFREQRTDYDDLSSDDESDYYFSYGRPQPQPSGFFFTNNNNFNRGQRSQFSPEHKPRGKADKFGYYSDDDVHETPRASFFGGASETSQHYSRDTNFTHASSQHGQFFQEKNTKSKSAKKRNKEMKQASKLAADKERSAASQPSNSQAYASAARSRSPSAEFNQKTGPKKAEDSPVREEQDKSTTRDSTEGKKNNSEEQPGKKTKKQIQQEIKQREREEKELREELLRQEKEKKEKLEKKRAVQEEKERQEREERQKNQEIIEAEERKRAEELRILFEKKDEEKKRKKREEERIRKLMEEFDSGNFLDEAGDFKSTDSDVKHIICRDDINPLGNISKNARHKNMETINGLNTESLIRLQDEQQQKDKPKPRPQQRVVENVTEPANGSRFGPIGSRPQYQPSSENKQPPPHTQRRTSEQEDINQANMQKYNQHRQQHLPFQPDHRRLYQQQPNSPHVPRMPYQPQSPTFQQHNMPRPNVPLLSQSRPSQFPPEQHRQFSPTQQPHFHHRPPLLQPPPGFDMPYWTPNYPPPPLNNINMNVPRPSGRNYQGGQINKKFINTRVFTPQRQT